MTRTAGLASLSPLSWALRAPLAVLSQAMRAYYIAIWFIDSLRPNEKEPTELTIVMAGEPRQCSGCPARISVKEVEIGGVVYDLCDGCARRLA